MIKFGNYKREFGFLGRIADNRYFGFKHYVRFVRKILGH